MDTDLTLTIFFDNEAFTFDEYLSDNYKILVPVVLLYSNKDVKKIAPDQYTHFCVKYFEEMQDFYDFNLNIGKRFNNRYILALRKTLLNKIDGINMEKRLKIFLHLPNY